MAQIRVLLADDHAVVRTGLRYVLESQGDIEVVGEAANGFEAIELAKELSPDVVLMDITMPKLNGLEAARQIRREGLPVGILFLTIHKEEEYLFHALRVGGSGYIPKSAQASEMLTAIRAVRTGEVYLHPSVTHSLVSDYLERARKGEQLGLYERLTDREKEILYLIAEGYTNREIAEAIHVSVNTVHNHRTSIMDKLGLHSRTELVKYAIQKGIISAENHDLTRGSSK